MKEYFVVTNSNAAPICSDIDTRFVKAGSPEEASKKTRKGYKHLAGLFALVVFADANDYHKGKKPLATWLSKRADIQQNGVKCPKCDGQTRLSVANTGEKGTDDIHTCKKCGVEVTVDMKTFKIKESVTCS